jgi:cytochrome c553
MGIVPQPGGAATSARLRVARCASRWARIFSSVIAVLALGAVPRIANAADYVDMRRLEPVVGDAAKGQAKAATICIGCHGPAGVSLVPTFPNVAGQKAAYLYHELLRYKAGSPKDSPMIGVMAAVDDADIANLSVYYASLAPSTSIAPIADQSVFDRGAELFRAGDPARGVPPCQGCHGEDGDGVDIGDERHPFAAYPRLRHQQATYLSARLQAYRDGKLADTSNDFAMTGIAARLSDDDIAAISAWLASAP